MKELNEFLAIASSKVGSEYFLLPVHESEEVHRERVYCYELYHQMRRVWFKREDKDFRLNGEVSKARHPDFVDIGNLVPDLLIHVPGSPRNYAVVEVKTAVAKIFDIKEDLNKLFKFVSELKNPYERGILLIYGDGSQQAAEALLEIPEKVEVWVHTEVKSAATRLK